MSYWTDHHPTIPEPQIGDVGPYVSVKIIINGIKVEVRFDIKEAAYDFSHAYAKATYAQCSLPLS